MKIFILLIMLFCHIVDDYYLQGLLAKLKQKSWWETNAPDKLYKYDYIIALLEHAFSWTFMIMLAPIVLAVINNTVNIIVFSIIFLTNWAIHTIVDDAKANRHEINLITDQLIHIAQIIITWIILV